MDDLFERPIEYFIACAVIWYLVGCLRLLRYATYFQLEGYDNRSYYIWFWQDDAEKRYLWLSLGFSAISVGAILELLRIEGLGTTLSGIASVVSPLLAFYFAPRDYNVSQP